MPDKEKQVTDSADTSKEVFHQRQEKNSEGDSFDLTDAVRGGLEKRNNTRSRPVGDVDLNVSIELGRICLCLRDLLELSPGSIIDLHKSSGGPLDIFVNGRKYAEGELLVNDNGFKVQVNAIIGPEQRLLNMDSIV